MGKGLAEVSDISVLTWHGGWFQSTENLGRATGYGLLTQKLGSSPCTMLDFLRGFGYRNDNLYEVCVNGWFKFPHDCRAVERGCPVLLLQYTKARVCVALQSMKKKDQRLPVFRWISEVNHPIRPCSHKKDCTARRGWLSAKWALQVPLPNSNWTPPLWRDGCIHLRFKPGILKAPKYLSASSLLKT